MNTVEKVEAKFRELFNESPLLFRSPGRVNLIGEHTDYNMGFVLPAAIDKAIYFAITPRSDDICNLHSIDFNESNQHPVAKIQHQEKHWANYLLGVVDQIQKLGYTIKGFNCVFGGDIPIGAGLSSSAAIEAGLAFALNHIFNLGIAKLEIVKLAQRAENEFVGVKCGIMDQYVNIFGSEKKVLRIDCRSLDYEYHPFEREDLRIVLCNTMVSHSLASSEYNARRAQCEEGVKILQQYYPHVNSLRDVEWDIIKLHELEFPPKVWNRCKYVIEENERLLKACEDLDRNDFVSFGYRMYQSHEGLRDLYEVSCKELDFLVDLASKQKGVLGSRMMGGGFGGCTINIIEHNKVNEFISEVSGKYQMEFDKKPDTYICTIENGTGLLH
ncbi:MAG: galactokinase [Melioribacter sp.]|nr:galactokinase [Melioribacter sp.]